MREDATSSGIDGIGEAISPTALTWSVLDLTAVAMGGACGALARFAIWHWTSHHWPRHAHLATFAVNALGSLILGVIAGWMLSRPMPDWAHRGLAIGALGAFTTYSTFALEAVKLHTAGRSATALGYVIATTLACLLLAGLGYWMASKIGGAGS